MYGEWFVLRMRSNLACMNVWDEFMCICMRAWICTIYYKPNNHKIPLLFNLIEWNCIIINFTWNFVFETINNPYAIIFLANFSFVFSFQFKLSFELTVSAHKHRQQICCHRRVIERTHRKVASIMTFLKILVSKNKIILNEPGKLLRISCKIWNSTYLECFSFSFWIVYREIYLEQVILF